MSTSLLRARQPISAKVNTTGDARVFEVIFQLRRIEGNVQETDKTEEIVEYPGMGRREGVVRDKDCE